MAPKNRSGTAGSFHLTKGRAQKTEAQAAGDLWGLHDTLRKFFN